MNNESVKQIEEFSELWHKIMKKSQFSNLEDQFPRIKGLTTTEIGIISIVSKYPDVILGEICSYLNIPKSTLTNAVDRLEKRKYINRTISKKDRRSYGLELTEEGHLAQKEHNELEQAVYGRLLNALDSNEEREELFKLLRKIVNNLRD
jgi:DNA-binding MarR family transcriptional regulator